MSDDLSASIEKLRSTASKLNELTDNLNATVRTVEDILGEQLSLGISAYVTVDTVYDHANALTTTQILGYQRVGSKYRISVAWVNDADPESPTVKPWSDCARDVKIATANKLPELIKEISVKSDEAIGNVYEATKTAEGVLHSLTRKGAK